MTCQPRNGCPVRALRVWLDSAGIDSGPVFRAVNRHGRVATAALSERSISKILKRAAARAGIDPQNISGHSLRAGMATTATIEGAQEREIARTTGHKSGAMVRRYIRDAELFRTNMTARLGLQEGGTSYINPDTEGREGQSSAHTDFVSPNFTIQTMKGIAMMSDENRNSNPDDAWDFVRVCRYHENCNRLLVPGGCDACDCMREDVLRDEDGEIIAIPDEPPDLAR